MSERKVLNKYYPPDFDPLKIPRLHLSKERQYTVRLMAPCNMKCKTCGEYIYKGKKFNARKETVQGEEYLGLKIFRFYIKCTRCLAEITFKTDPQNADYIVEHGATRNFQALKLAEEQAEREQKELEEEEASNPMKLLENRTKASKREMDVMETLEELRDLNQRQAKVDYDGILGKYAEHAAALQKKQEDEDEAFVQSLFGKEEDGKIIKRLADIESDDEDLHVLPTTLQDIKKPSDLLSEVSVPSMIQPPPTKKPKIWEKSVGSLSTKSSLTSLVKPKRVSTEGTKSDSCSSAHSGLGLIGAYSESSSEDTE